MKRKHIFIFDIRGYDCNADKEGWHRDVRYNGSSSRTARPIPTTLLSAARETAKNSSRVRAVLDKRKALL